jgi:MoaA/NifB/PqqE/SkfB family radical SAM enzyme
MFPKVVNFMITNQCNSNCVYCYAKSTRSELPTKKIKKIIDLLKSKGVKGIVLCGGEPTMRKDFRTIVKYTKKQNIKIFLDTNGDFFSKYEKLITKYISVLSFPIDFPDKSYRNDKNLRNILNNLSFYKNKPRPRICIGTVVTKENYLILSKIGDLIKTLPVDMWILYQFTPSGGNAKKNKKILEIPDKLFFDSTKKLTKQFSKHFKVIISPTNERSKAYFLIKPDGTVFSPIKKEKHFNEISFGKIFDPKTIKKWESEQKQKNYNKKTIHFDQENILRN